MIFLPGRYAVSLYDKHKGNGVRIYLDLKKLLGWDEIQAWLLKLKTRRSKGDIGLCSVCGEAYSVKDGSICLWCQGESSYETPVINSNGRLNRS